jgi:molybdate transport system regulatory protein
MKEITAAFKATKSKVNGSIWLEGKVGRFLGPGPVQLMELIDETGSISKAAARMEMSYKKAWEIVNRLNSALKHPMIVTAAGGEKGGGSTLSAEAKDLITYYHALRKRFQRFLDEESAMISS